MVENLLTGISHEDIGITVTTLDGLSNTIKCDFLRVFSEPNQQYDAYAEISFSEINGWRINGSRVEPSNYKSLSHPTLGKWNIISQTENKPYGLYRGQLSSNNPVCLNCLLVKA
ncbi:hypothetical protein [Anabaena azotica]|uniref:hypothetical protein n=1 Tax=Anabaena azotica TaxID=197653 RepID=UPI0039A728FD